MKIWEILKKENIGKKYKTKIYGSIEEIVEVDYDINTNIWLTVRDKNKLSGTEYPLKNIYLEKILELEFEEIK